MKKKDFNYYSGKKYDGMMSRCYREKDPSFKHYNSKGIRVCSAWIKNIEVFRTWMRSKLIELQISEEYFCENSKELQLDRVDGNGHYCPENCTLSSPQQNARNKKNTVRYFISAEGETIEV